MDFISSDQALELLKSNPENYTTPDSIRGLISRVDMNTPGEITILYSGSYTDGGIPTSANDIVQAMVRNGDDIRIINNTQVAKLLGTPEFVAAAGKAWGFTDVIEIKGAYNDRSSSFNQFFFAAEDGLWADASKRFVAETVGEVRTLTAYAEHGRTFDLVELPGVLRNPNITYIDGIDNSLLQNHYNTILANGNNNDVARGAIFDAVTARSYDASASLHYNVANVDGKPVTYIDSRDYFAPYGVEGHVNDGNIIYKPLPLSPPSDAHMAGRATNQGFSESISRELKLMDASLDMAKYAKSMNNLYRMGMVGDIIGLSMVLNEANAAYLQGDSAKAQSLINGWLIGFGGGFVAAGVALEALSPVLGAIAATGPVGVAVAGGLSLLVGITAGFFGAELSLSIAHWLDTLFNNAANYTDPLIVDLDGDGIETLASSATLLFDFDGDGVKTGTGWVGQDDALLVLDRNNDGLINSGQELFGTDTVKQDGTLAKSGFDALRDLDSNLDGQFDAQDAQFSLVRLWQDINSDGIAQSNELKSLTEYGIRAFELTSQESQLSNNGNVITQVGQFIREDGTSGQIAELDLAINPFYQEFADDAQRPIDATGLPDLQGTGAVHDLHAAIKLSPELARQVIHYSTATTVTEQLAQLDSLLDSWGSTAQYATFEQRLAAESSETGKLHFVWSWQKPGQNREPTPAELAKQTLLNKIALLEAFNGADFFLFSHQESQGNLTLTLRNAGQILMTKTYALTGNPQDLLLTEADFTLPVQLINKIEQSYNTLRQMAYQGLAAQTRLQEYLGLIGISFDASGSALDYSRPLALLQSRVEQDPLSAFLDARSLELRLSDGAWNEALQRIKIDSVNQLTGSSLQTLKEMLISLNEPITIGTSANDVLVATASTTPLQLFGGAGDDQLSVLSHDNILSGGRGNDTFKGGTGNDTYLFNSGDGHDVIDEYGGHNSLIFGAGINLEDIDITHQGNDMFISIHDGQDSITIKNVLNSGQVNTGYLIENMQFSDGKVLTWQQILDAGIVSRATSDNGVILNGYSGGDNRLFGGAGDDQLSVSGHDNILSGGRGNDTFKGGTGNDTYLFNSGDGHDVIDEYGGHNSLIFGAGINLEDIDITHQGNDMFISIHDGQDSITIKNVFNSSQVNTGYLIENMQFSDGKVLTWQEILDAGIVSRATSDNGVILNGYSGGDNRLFGGAGDDQLSVSGHDNILSGGRGNDTFKGGTGNDTYLFNSGDGHDVIDEYGGHNSLIFGAGINLEDIDITHQGKDMFISIHDGQDSITIKNVFTSGQVNTGYLIENMQFSDGKVLTWQEILDAGIVSRATSDNGVILNGYSGGDNRLFGGAGDDQLSVSGHDNILSGGRGNDTFKGGTGNDTYLFNSGDGHDVIDEYGGHNSLIFGAGINLEDIDITHQGKDMFISIHDGQDSITIKNVFTSGQVNTGYLIENMQFSDGKVLTWQEILDAGIVSRATSDNGVILNGYSGGDNRLFGGAGDDQLSVSGHDNILSGGRGNDTFKGGSGNDTYLFNSGDGHDVIDEYGGHNSLIFGAGINLEDIDITHQGKDMFISIHDGQDSITIKNVFTSGQVNTGYLIENMQFSDGKVLTWQQIENSGAISQPAKVSASYHGGGYSSGSPLEEQGTSLIRNAPYMERSYMPDIESIMSNVAATTDSIVPTHEQSQVQLLIESMATLGAQSAGTTLLASNEPQSLATLFSTSQE